MSTYYNYYLERKEADGKWSAVLPEETDPYTLKLSFYYTSGIGQVFLMNTAAGRSVLNTAAKSIRKSIRSSMKMKVILSGTIIIHMKWISKGS